MGIPAEIASPSAAPTKSVFWPAPSTLLLVALAAVIPYLLLPPKPFFVSAEQAITRNRVVQEAPLIDAFSGGSWGAADDAGSSPRSYRPAVSLSYAIQARLLGSSPASFHLVDMALHAGAATLLALLLALLLPDRRWAPWAATLFAVHPAVSEAVCSAVGRADLMAGAALLGALVLHFTAGRARQPWLNETMALALIGLALLSADYAIAFPLVLVVFDVVRKMAGQSTNQDLRRGRFVWGGGFALLACYLLLRVAAVSGVDTPPPIFGGDHPLDGKSVVVRLATAFWLAAPSLRLLVLPLRLNHAYTLGALPIAEGPFDPRALFGIALLAVLAALSVRVLALSRDPLPVMALALFTLPLAPALNTVSLAGGLFSERFLYLPAAAFSMLAAWALTRWAAGGHAERVAQIGFSAVLVAFAGLTVLRVNDWSSNEALARSSIKSYPAAGRTWFDLGVALNAQGKHDEALRCFERSVQLQGDRAAAWTRYAIALGLLSRHAEAAKAWQRSLALSPPDSGALWRLMGEAQLRAGNAEEAVRALTRAQHLMREDQSVFLPLARAQLLLAQQRLAAGHPDEAVAMAEKAAQLGQLPPEGMFLAGLVLRRAGESDRAKPFFDQALAKDPELLRKKHQVAIELDQAGQHEQAADLLREILVVKPDQVATLFNLGAALLKAGRAAEAVGYLEAGLELQPDPGARSLLAEARRRATAETTETAKRRPVHAP